MSIGEYCWTHLKSLKHGVYSDLHLATSPNLPCHNIQRARKEPDDDDVSLWRTARTFQKDLGEVDFTLVSTHFTDPQVICWGRKKVTLLTISIARGRNFRHCFCDVKRPDNRTIYLRKCFQKRRLNFC